MGPAGSWFPGSWVLGPGCWVLALTLSVPPQPNHWPREWDGETEGQVANIQDGNGARGGRNQLNCSVTLILDPCFPPDH